MLANAFQGYESFQRARVVKDRKNGYSRGYGFVKFATVEDAQHAIEMMEGKVIDKDKFPDAY